jgi:hypothetical protein
MPATSKARAAADSGTTDPSPGNNFATATITVRQ